LQIIWHDIDVPQLKGVSLFNPPGIVTATEYGPQRISKST